MPTYPLATLLTLRGGGWHISRSLKRRLYHLHLLDFTNVRVGRAYIHLLSATNASASICWFSAVLTEATCTALCIPLTPTIAMTIHCLVHAVLVLLTLTWMNISLFPPCPLQQSSSPTSTLRHFIGPSSPQQPPSTNRLRCALANVRSLCNKPSLIAELIISQRLSILFITESWLKGDEEYDAAVLTDATPINYSFLSVPRANKRGGGLVMIYHNSLKVNHVVSVNNYPSFENAVFDISCSNKSFLGVLIYRQPSSSLAAFSADFDLLCTDLLPHEEILIVGDFNIPSQAPNTDFSSTLVSHSLRQHVTFPTHRQGNTLDLIITRSTSTLISDISPICGVCDHDVVIFSVNLTSRSYICNTITTRRLKSIDHNSFGKDLLNVVTIPICTMFNAISMANADGLPSDVPTRISSDAASVFNAKLRLVLDNHAPLFNKRIKNRQPVPWWSPEIASSRRKLRNAEKLWRSTRLSQHRDAFVLAKYAHHQIISDCKRRHILNELSKMPLTSKQTWGQFHRMLGRHRPSPLPETTSPDQLALDFNEFFLAKPRELRRVLASNPPGALLTPPTLPKLPTPINAHLSSFAGTNSREVRKLIQKSSTKTSVADPIPTSFVHRHLEVLLPAITSLMNCVLINGMPQCWKDSLVSPRLKKSGLDHSSLSSYRPINQLPFFSKIAERLVLNRLMNFLESHNLLDPYQNAYRRQHSCESALTYLHDYSLASMDAGKITVVVLLDLSAAFDCVDHDILLTILQSIGITGSVYQWLQHYLTNRQQSVIIKSTSSPPLPLRYGVPQGSVLGPVLFIIYLLGLRDVISPHNIKYVVFADDIQLFVSASPHELPQIILRLQTCIIDLRNWLSTRRLTLNSIKSDLILLGQPRALNKCIFPGIQVCDSFITPRETVRSLGVHLDSTLSLDFHINKIRAAAFGRLRLIARVRKFLKRNECTLLIKSLVISRLDFCAPLLMGVSNKTLNRLQLVINSSVRLVHGLKKRQNIDAILLAEGWLSVADRIKFRALLLLHGVITSGTPAFLAELLREYVPPRTLRTTSMHLLHTPRVRTQVAERAFRHYAPRLWNSLPQQARDDLPHHQFRNVCLEFLSSS